MLSSPSVDWRCCGLRSTLSESPDHTYHCSTRRGEYLGIVLNKNKIYSYHTRKLIVSDLIYHGVKDGLHPSDLQRYACIDSNGEKIPIEEYHLYGIRNRNTKDVIRGLYYASINLDPDRTADGTLNLTGESAAFRVFLGAKLNLSNIYFGQDMRLNIQSAAIQKADEELMRYQLTFVSAE